MLEAHLVSVKELVGPTVFLFDVPVGCEVAVFAISHDWVANRSEVSTNLMGSSCKEFHFNEGEAHDGLEAKYFFVWICKGVCIIVVMIVITVVVMVIYRR